MAERIPKTRPRAPVIALDLGGTKLASCLFDEAGHPYERRVTPLERRQGRAVGELIAKEACRLRDHATKLGARAAVVGVSVPGIVNEQTGRVWAPNIPGWEDYPLQSELEAALADDSHPLPKVVIDSDRAAYILGESWQGAARGCRDAIYLAVGTGIGAGILADGRVLRGAHGIAGAIGWLALDRP
ncbi:MAG TPA: ROK family protein, partial [Lacipirellula sp.]